MIQCAGQTVPTLTVDPMPSSKRETGVRVDPLEADCDTGADPCLGLRLFLVPGQHPTPCEGKEGSGIVGPLLPGRRQIKQLFCRGGPVASDAGMQLTIATFSCSIGGEGSDPIRP